MSDWTPEHIALLRAEFHEQRALTRQLVEVMRDLNDTIAAFMQLLLKRDARDAMLDALDDASQERTP